MFVPDAAVHPTPHSVVIETSRIKKFTTVTASNPI